MADEYDYLIQVREIKPPLGTMRFEAKVSHLVKNPGENSKRIDPTVHLHLHWGKTEAEARKKAQEEVDAWIAQQQGMAGEG